MTESEAFDELDLQLLHAFEVDGRAPFSRVAAVLGVSDQTVARRFRRMCAGAGLRIVGVRDTHRLGRDQWMLRLRCAPDGAEAIAAALARRPDTRWIHLTSAGTEVVCMTLPRTSGEYEDLLFGKLLRTRQVIEITAYQLLHRFYGGRTGWIGKHGMLTSEQVAALRPGPTPEVGQQGSVHIAPEDEPLVAALKADGRVTYPELQRVTGRSESAVKRRLTQLLDTGAVYIDTEYNTESFGFGTAAMLWVTVDPGALDRVGRAMAGHPEIAHVSATTGPSNLMASVLTRDTAELYAYLSGELGALEGVRHVESAPYLRRFKQLTYPRPLR
ncbi:Lrp/AsnC family transcriptional regulator [Streptomyces kanamyceticus]|uniref:AsnC family transcriptional regulator n=1 Tax=Streptomyces kanamyceticus TaxID=1967 RepID=A0A5J6G942_STRKN|nr:AsnC family transcriptional regulator [Streptomyces kanamyceticus]QEU90458.1 AsnC family transcriptional regulator [Streptomyces kanamyceticus]